MTKDFLETDQLSFKGLNELFNDRVCILLVKQFASKEVCKKLNDLLLMHADVKYHHEIRKNKKIQLEYYGVNRYGYPLNIVCNDETGEKYNQYIESALTTMQNIRNAASPYLSPIDKLRVELDELWPHNSNVAIINGQKAFCGIGRIMPSELSHLSEGQPHFDLVSKNYFPNLLRQYAANIYINVPESGGELEIWNTEPIDINKVDTFKIPKDWRSILSESIKIKPEQGDLFIFNTCRPHAVTRFEGENLRTSIQSFIGLNKEMNLSMWN